MIILIASTNRPKSNTLRLTEFYKKILLEKGEEVEILSLMELPERLMVTDLYGQRSREFQVILDKMLRADKYIFLIPEYNGSFPGVLKLFIDCFPFPESFLRKKTALVGLSSGTYGNIRGIDHFTGICHYVGLKVLPLKLHIPYIKKELDLEGNIIGENTLKFIEQQIDEFIRF
jgi:chromate reductase, NAD(P)H dehydrogenase (quinone)